MLPTMVKTKASIEPNAKGSGKIFDGTGKGARIP